MGKILKYMINNKNLDDPSTTISRAKILKEKYFLRRIYIEFYNTFLKYLSSNNKDGKIIELGSGAGFIKDIIPSAITSDILRLPSVDLIFSAAKMPLKNKSINAFVMIDVFHHINNVEAFLKEAERCLKKGGQIIMIEPSGTILSKFIYTYFHHEDFNQNTTWQFQSKGPLSSSNAALPWIVFFRDRNIFEKKFPQLKINDIEIKMPLRYILSGGFSTPQLLPDFFYKPIEFIEKLLKPINKYTGLFYTINITKR